MLHLLLLLLLHLLLLMMLQLLRRWVHLGLLLHLGWHGCHWSRIHARSLLVSLLLLIEELLQLLLLLLKLLELLRIHVEERKRVAGVVY